MSLRWDCSGVHRHDVVCFTQEGKQRVVTGRIIEGMVAVQIGHLRNEDDAREFYLRYHMWRALFHDLSPWPPEISWEDVKLHIGLLTNVPTRPGGMFLQDMWDMNREHLLMSEGENP